MRTDLRTRFALLALPALLACREARADAVPPPPTDCPPGTHGVTGHAGPGCVPDRCPPGAHGDMCSDGPCCAASLCGGDAGRTCGSNSSCQEVKACVRPRFRIGWGASRIPTKEILATCDASGACPGGGTCETLMACVAKAPSNAPPGAPSPSAFAAPGKGKLGCSMVGSEGEAMSAAALCLALGAAWARRRRPRSPAR